MNSIFGDRPFRIEDQAVEKSIILYDVPPARQAHHYPLNGNNLRKYKLQEEPKYTQNLQDSVLCLNCNHYVLKDEVDQHSRAHVTKENHPYDLV